MQLPDDSIRLHKLTSSVEVVFPTHLPILSKILPLLAKRHHAFLDLEFLTTDNQYVALLTFSNPDDVERLQSHLLRHYSSLFTFSSE